MAELRPDGYLPEGLHFATETEVEALFGTTNMRRRTLMRQLSYFLQLARAAGALRFFLNGSFVTTKPEPGDVDAVCLVPEDGQPKSVSPHRNCMQLRWRGCPKNYSSPTQKAVGING